MRVSAGIRWLAAMLAVVSSSIAAHAQLTQRQHEPVVVSGSTIPSLIGADPSRIVGFGYHDGWTQIPIQIDQRLMLDFGTILHTTPTGLSVLSYADPNTFTGADANPAFDADDELVFIAGDADVAPGAVLEPAGTVPGTGVRLGVTDPISGEQAFVYLFVGDGTLSPAAGVPPITYTFNLLSGPYKTTFNTAFGPNPENSSVVTDAYSVHFADRWVRDATRVTRDGASGVDILDRHRFVFAPGNCIRTEQTFTEGQGAFMFNLSGPLRALRGYVGANSGYTTYRTHKFYAFREDITTALRVHSIPGMVDFFDYAPAAAGMTYRDSLNTGGVPVDGTADAIAGGPYQWGMVTGTQGTLVHVPIVSTDIPGFAYGTYYSDDQAPSPRPCTGDTSVFAASGFQTGLLPNTDPTVTPVSMLTLRDTIIYGGPSKDTAYAQTVNSRVRQPLTIGVATSAGQCPDGDLDGHAVCVGSCLLGAGHVCGDCDDLNGQVLAAPIEVSSVVVRRVAGVTQLSWSGQSAAGPGTAFDVVSGSLASLVALRGFGAASCVTSSNAGTSFNDPRPDPTPSSGFYYLLRARNSCGIATYGSSGLSPDPRATLDASSLCP